MHMYKGDIIRTSDSTPSYKKKRTEQRDSLLFLSFFLSFFLFFFFLTIRTKKELKSKVHFCVLM